MNSSLDHALALLARGLLSIPVPHKCKGPTVKGWQTLRLSADDLPRYFNGAPSNIGVLLGEPSGWIVDVDLDHARAVELADTFLPHTAMTWGRASKPRSHRLFRLTRPAETRKWTDKSTGMIAELRSGGCQTIAPGSVHPGGEVVRWDDDGEPAMIDPADLIAAVEKLAAAVLAEVGAGHATPGEASGAGTIGTKTTAYGRAALKAEADRVTHARPPIGDATGERHDTLNKAAYSLGGLIAGEELDEGEAVAELRLAARACGLPEKDAERTIADGIAAGKQHPRQRPATGGTTKSVGTVRERVPPERPRAYSPFPVDTLPEPIRSFVADTAKAMRCDPSYIALPLLSALAAAIGNTHRIALKRGWPEPAILWTAIVGESGTMKTPAFKSAMRAIRKAQDVAWEEYKAARAEYDAEYLRFEANLTAWKRKAASGKGDAGDPPEKPTPPIARRYIVSDTTTEALAPILLGNPRGVLLARDELSGWIGSFDRYAKSGKAGADSAHWLSMHNGEAMTIDRKTGIPPTIHVPSASVSIAGGVQPGILAKAMGQEHHESGMLARLLFAMPPRRVKKWTEAEVDPKTEEAVAAVFAHLFALTPTVDPAGDEVPVIVRLDPDAKAAWVVFYNEHAAEQADLSGDLSAAWSKLEGYAARLALVIHLTRRAAGDTTPNDPARNGTGAVIEGRAPIPAAVDEASIAAGITLARWFGNEAKRVYAILAESDEDREHRRLVELIEGKGGAVSVRDWQRARSLPSADSARAELARLVDAEYGRWECPPSGPAGGAPTELFRLTAAADNTPSGNTASGVSSVSEDRDGGEWGKL